MAIPFLAMSWWLSQQDFIFERGQQVNCDVEGNTCSLVQSFPIKYYDEIHDGLHQLNYSTHDGESIVLLENFNYPIKATYYDEAQSREIEFPELTAEKLKEYGCQINGNLGFSYSCSLDHLSFEQNSGKFQFVKDSDAIKFKNLMSVAKSELKHSETIRIWLALSFFLGFFISFFLIALVIRFVIYGFAANNKKQ